MGDPDGTRRRAGVGLADLLRGWAWVRTRQRAGVGPFEARGRGSGARRGGVGAGGCAVVRGCVHGEVVVCAILAGADSVAHTDVARGNVVRADVARADVARGNVVRSALDAFLPRGESIR